MTNQDKMIQSATDLVTLLNDLTGSINNNNNYDSIMMDMELVDKVTTNLKRMGETLVLDVGVEPIAEESIVEEITIEKPKEGEVE